MGNCERRCKRFGQLLITGKALYKKQLLLLVSRGMGRVTFITPNQLYIAASLKEFELEYIGSKEGE